MLKELKLPKCPKCGATHEHLLFNCRVLMSAKISVNDNNQLIVKPDDIYNSIIDDVRYDMLIDNIEDDWQEMFCTECGRSFPAHLDVDESILSVSEND